MMLSLASAKDTTWSSIDITSVFLNADIHEDDTVLVTPGEDGHRQAQHSQACEESHLWTARSTASLARERETTSRARIHV